MPKVLPKAQRQHSRHQLYQSLLMSTRPALPVSCNLVQHQNLHQNLQQKPQGPPLSTVRTTRSQLISYEGTLGYNTPPRPSTISLDATALRDVFPSQYPFQSSHFISIRVPHRPGRAFTAPAPNRQTHDGAQKPQGGFCAPSCP